MLGGAAGSNLNEIAQPVDAAVGQTDVDAVHVQAAGGLLHVGIIGRRARHFGLFGQCGLAAEIGVTFDIAGPVSEQAVEIDELFRTSVAGVFAAGDICTQMPQMAAAIAAGSAAAASVIASVLEQE